MSEIKKILIFKEFNMKNNILLSAILAGMISIPLSGVYAAPGDSNVQAKKAELNIVQKKSSDLVKKINLSENEKAALKKLAAIIKSDKDMKSALEKIANVKMQAGGKEKRTPSEDNGFNFLPKKVKMSDLIGKKD